MSFASPIPGAVLLRIKAVPGAKRNEVVGRLGDRLKVRVSQPPEGGKANRAICDLLAEELGVHSRAATIVSGASSPEKTVRIEGVTPVEVENRWPD